MGSSPTRRTNNRNILGYRCGKIAELEVPGVSQDFRGRLAQLVRASVLHTGGQRFEPSIAHHFLTVPKPFVHLAIRAIRRR